MTYLPYTFFTTPTSSNPIPASELDDNFTFVANAPHFINIANRVAPERNRHQCQYFVHGFRWFRNQFFG